MTQQPWEDPNWREIMKGYTTNERELHLLEHGPDSLASSWRLMALHGKFKKMMGYKEPSVKDLGSSFKKFSEGIE